jgi:hypothetical protein
LWWPAAVLVAAVALAAASCGPRSTTVETPPVTPEGPAGPFFFKDITTASGIDFTYKNGEEAGHLAILESLGGGGALIDYDGDGLLDIFVTGGGYFSKTRDQFNQDKTKPPEIKGHPCKLYKNLGGGKFKDVTKEVGLEDFPWFYTHGAAVADFNRDGWPDLLVTGWDRVALFQNVPVDPNDPKKGRKFIDVTEKAGLKGTTWTSSAAWADLDGDGYPDLYLCCYADWSFANHPDCNYDGKTPDVCPPKQFNGLPHRLYRNNGDGTFTDVSAEAGLHKGGKDASKGLGVVAVSVLGNGKPDLWVANDTVDKFFYVNHCTPGKFRFEERGLVSGLARDGGGKPNGSMGMGVSDYDRCGRPSLWVTNYAEEQHGLYHNECLFRPTLTHGAALGAASGAGRPSRVFYSFKTSPSGIGRIGNTWVGWGTGFLDVDNHGWEDLFIANGHAIRFPKGAGITRAQRPVLLRNVGGGKFEDVSRRGGSYFDKGHVSRGVALGDLDNDGRIDLVISNLNEPIAVLHNEAPADNHWLGIELVGKEFRDVVGAKVILEVDGQKQTRFAIGGGSYASSSDRRLVFGLGKADKIDRLTVIWPRLGDRQWTEQRFDGLAVDRYHRLVEGKAEPEVPPGSGK